MPKTDVIVNLVGQDGNAFYILGAVSKALKKAGYNDEAEEFLIEAKSGDYDYLLQTAMDYVEIE